MTPMAPRPGIGCPDGTARPARAPEPEGLTGTPSPSKAGTRLRDRDPHDPGTSEDHVNRPNATRSDPLIEIIGGHAAHHMPLLASGETYAATALETTDGHS